MILSDGGEEVLGRGERGVHCVVGVEPREVPDHGRSCVCVCVCVVEEGRGGGERGGGGRDREERRGGVLGGAGCVLHRGPTGHTHTTQATHTHNRLCHTSRLTERLPAGRGGAGRRAPHLRRAAAHRRRAAPKARPPLDESLRRLRCGAGAVQEGTCVPLLEEGQALDSFCVSLLEERQA